MVGLQFQIKKSLIKELITLLSDKYLVKKLSLFAADNTNFNFGFANHKGNENVWRKLQAATNR